MRRACSVNSTVKCGPIAQPMTAREYRSSSTGQIQPALQNPDIGEITGPDSVGLWHPELAGKPCDEYALPPTASRSWPGDHHGASAAPRDAPPPDVPVCGTPARYSDCRRSGDGRAPGLPGISSGLHRKEGRSWASSARSTDTDCRVWPCLSACCCSARHRSRRKLATSRSRATCTTGCPDSRTNRTASSVNTAVYDRRVFVLIPSSDFLLLPRREVAVKSGEVKNMLRIATTQTNRTITASSHLHC